MNSCGDKEQKPALTIPDTYASANFDANTSKEATLRTEISGLSTALKAADNGSKITESSLTEKYSGTALKSATTSYYQGKVATWISDLALASGNTFDLENAPSGEGGLFINRVLDENGIELQQLIEKGLYAAAMYNHAITIIDGTLTEASIDQLVKAFGAHPTFPNSDAAANNPDVYAAKYAARRTRSTGGFYLDIKKNLITAKAAIVAGSAYNAERDQALNEFKLNWEKSAVATTINYLLGAYAKLNKANLTNTDRVDALHDYSEAVAFLHGWRTIPQKHKKITDAQIDALLTLLKAPYNATPTSYEFAKNPSANIGKFEEAINQIKSIYGFTDQQVSEFAFNWVSQEKR